MTAPDVIPHDLVIEEALLGTVFSAPWDQRRLALDSLAGEDFYGDLHRAVFDAFGRMHRRGDAVDDVALLTSELKLGGWPEVDLSALRSIVKAGTGRNVTGYVETLTRYSVARRVLAAGLEVSTAARAAQMGPDELVDYARETFASIDVPLVNGDALLTLTTMDQFLDEVHTTPAPWVVPGLIRAGWRVMIVAAEGHGKSVATRQIGFSAAAGIHPFTHDPVPPARTLILDLENPDDAIEETARRIRDVAAATGGYDPDRVFLWRRPEGINLRNRTDRAAFHKALERTRPDLVVIGPLYKAFRKVAREDHEDAAAEVQAVLDDARSRYGFALLIEHHAPKGSSLGNREMMPFGSSLWQRWPEIGLALDPASNEGVARLSLVVNRFRRDRVKNDWPQRLDRGAGHSWPWDGAWSGPMPSYAHLFEESA